MKKILSPLSLVKGKAMTRGLTTAHMLEYLTAPRMKQEVSFPAVSCSHTCAKLSKLPCCLFPSQTLLYRKVSLQVLVASAQVLKREKWNKGIKTMGHMPKGRKT